MTQPKSRKKSKISGVGSELRHLVWSSTPSEELEPIEQTVPLMLRLLLEPYGSYAGMTVPACASALGVDEDSVHRWRRGGPVSGLADKAIRYLLVMRVLAPGLVPGIGLKTLDELLRGLDEVGVRFLTPLDLTRERKYDKQRRELVKRGPTSTDGT